MRYLEAIAIATRVLIWLTIMCFALAFFFARGALAHPGHGAQPNNGAHSHAAKGKKPRAPVRSAVRS